MSDMEFFADGTLAKCVECGYVLWHNQHLPKGESELRCVECDDTTTQETLVRCHEGGGIDSPEALPRGLFKIPNHQTVIADGKRDTVDGYPAVYARSKQSEECLYRIVADGGEKLRVDYHRPQDEPFERRWETMARVDP